MVVGGVYHQVGVEGGGGGLIIVLVMNQIFYTNPTTCNQLASPTNCPGLPSVSLQSALENNSPSWCQSLILRVMTESG